jgi:hypothetical protein
MRQNLRSEVDFHIYHPLFSTVNLAHIILSVLVKHQSNFQAWKLELISKKENHYCNYRR